MDGLLAFSRHRYSKAACNSNKLWAVKYDDKFRGSLAGNYRGKLFKRMYRVDDAGVTSGVVERTIVTSFSSKSAIDRKSMLEWV